MPQSVGSFSSNHLIYPFPMSTSVLGGGPLGPFQDLHHLRGIHLEDFGNLVSGHSHHALGGEEIRRENQLRMVGSWNLPTFYRVWYFISQVVGLWISEPSTVWKVWCCYSRSFWFLLQKISANTKANGKDVALQIQSWDILLPQVNDFTCGAKGKNKIPFSRNAAMIWLTSFIMNEIGLRILPNAWKKQLVWPRIKDPFVFDVEMTLKKLIQLVVSVGIASKNITNLISNSRFNGYSTVRFQNPKWLKSEYHEFRNSWVPQLW